MVCQGLYDLEDASILILCLTLLTWAWNSFTSLKVVFFSSSKLSYMLFSLPGSLSLNPFYVVHSLLQCKLREGKDHLCMFTAVCFMLLHCRHSTNIWWMIGIIQRVNTQWVISLSSFLYLLLLLCSLSFESDLDSVLQARNWEYPRLLFLLLLHC